MFDVNKLYLNVPVLSDAVILDSLCKMFGLLESVKQTLDLKLSQGDVQDDDYGENDRDQDYRMLLN